MATPPVQRISLVTIPVTDQERSKAFYVDALDFTVTMDFEMGADVAGTAGAGARWLTLTPPGAAPTSPWSPGSATPARPDRRPVTTGSAVAAHLARS